MSIFDGTILNEEILKVNGFAQIGINKWGTSWLTFIKAAYLIPESCTVSIRIDIDQNVFNVNIVVSATYIQYTKQVQIKDSIEFYTLLHQLEDIEYEYLIDEFQMVTVC